jgi:hypothetical protein
MFVVVRQPDINDNTHSAYASTGNTAGPLGLFGAFRVMPIQTIILIILWIVPWIAPMECIMATSKTVPSTSSRRDIDPPMIRHEGTTIILPAVPDAMPIDKAIEWLTMMQREQETMIVVTEMIDVYPWDGARAFNLAIRNRFGFAKTSGSIFNPPQQRNITVDVGIVESIPWGGFKVPGIDGTVYTGSTRNNNGQLVFKLTAEVRKKHAGVITELAHLTREILSTDSIYRGKAIRFALDEMDQQVAPEFIDLSRVNADELVFTVDVTEQIDTTIFAPLRRRGWCHQLGIPFKRGVCLIGPYGVGKTLAVYVAAQHAKAHGITSIIVENAETLPQAMLFARQYAPALVVVEDIDRVTKQRDDLCNEIMDSLDGVEAKESDVMVLFTSNHHDSIHPAMRRPGRIDTFIRIDAPDVVAVDRLLRLYGRGLIEPGADLRMACDLLSGQIPAVIREVVERSKLAAIARAETMHDARTLSPHDITIAAKRLLMQQKLFAPVKSIDQTAETVDRFGRLLAGPLLAEMQAEYSKINRGDDSKIDRVISDLNAIASEVDDAKNGISSVASDLSDVQYTVNEIRDNQ